MLLKVHKAYRDVIALCDKELLGKRFEEGKMQLELKDSFYSGEEIDENKAIDVLMENQEACFNIVGKKACNAALKAGVIEKESIKTVQSIPLALSLL